eukprot:6174218-Pleurochrysis_carterae.AAC.3
MSASTTLAAAAACASRLGWWNASTVSISQPDRTSMPPFPTCIRMSSSGQSSAAEWKKVKNEPYRAK